MSDGSVIFVLAVVYFLPALFAMLRGHHQVAAITVLNLLLGWTGIGWAVAMVWSFTLEVKQRD